MAIIDTILLHYSKHDDRALAEIKYDSLPLINANDHTANLDLL